MEDTLEKNKIFTPAGGRTKRKKVTGVIFVTVGLIALITPFTPGSWLIFVGLESLGIHFFFWEKISHKFIKRNPKQ